MKKRSPKIAAWILRLFRNNTDHESLLGDYEEMFRLDYDSYGHKRARAHYWLQVLRSLPTFLTNSIYWSIVMFKNYMKIAFRNLKSHRAYSFINISGLAIGIACCLLILLYIRFERSYDNYHDNGERIYRIGIDINTPSFKQTFASVAFSVGPYLRDQFPQVEFSGRIWPRPNRLVKVGEKVFYENRFYHIDEEIFDILSIPFLIGDAETALDRPEGIVIAHNIARKYFGSDNPMGKTIDIGAKIYEVTGVTADPRNNTHFKFDFLTSLQTAGLGNWINRDWGSTMARTYLKLSPNTDLAALIDEIKVQVKEGVINSGETNAYFLQPIEDIHLHSHLAGELEPPGNPTYLKVFSIIAVLILLIAGMNFINLSTAYSAKRSKEVGIRKVVGAARLQLVRQFLGESMLLTLFAVLEALILTRIALPYLNDTFNLHLVFADLFSTDVIIALMGLILFSGLIAGSYPAFFLAAFRPVSTLKGLSNSGKRRTIVGHGLIIGQFAISIVLIVGTLVFYFQLSHMKNKNLGFAKEQKLILPLRSGVNISENYEAVKQEFLRNNKIIGATASRRVPGAGSYGFNTQLVGEADSKSQWMHYNFVDSDFIIEYGLEVIEGRPFREGSESDVNQTFVVNQQAVQAFGWLTAEEAIGKRIQAGLDSQQGEVIGVVKDFHFQGLQREVGPLVMNIRPTQFSSLTLTLSTEDLAQTLAYIQNKWNELFPAIPFEYYFLDVRFDQQYQSEERVGKLVGTFTLLGLFVACLGLMGLSAYSAEQKTKEIGIRKVLGATVLSVTALLSKDFVKLVLLANVIACPIAWYTMNRWLQNFAYRIEISWWVFATAGCLALIIALVTVSTHAIRAAMANPVDSLHYE